MPVRAMPRRATAEPPSGTTLVTEAAVNLKVEPVPFPVMLQVPVEGSAPFMNAVPVPEIWKTEPLRVLSATGLSSLNVKVFAPDTNDHNVNGAEGAVIAPVDLLKVNEVYVTAAPLLPAYASKDDTTSQLAPKVKVAVVFVWVILAFVLPSELPIVTVPVKA